MKKNKAYYEEKFMAEIIAAGIVNYAVMYEKGNYYYCFFMKDGDQRYWTNIAANNLEKIKELINANKASGGGGNGS